MHSFSKNKSRRFWGNGPFPWRGVGWDNWHYNILSLLAALCLFFMMTVTAIDVFGRYLLGQPLPGAFELTEIMMGCLIFTGLPLVSANDGHVSVSLVEGFLGDRAKRLLAILKNAVGALVVALMAWVLWHKAGQMMEYGDTTAYLRIPKAPVAYLMSGLCGVTVLYFLRNTWRNRKSLTDPNLNSL